MILMPEIFNALAGGFGAVDIEGNWVVPCGYLDAGGSLDFELGGSDGARISIPTSKLFGTQYYGSDIFDDKAGACDFQFQPVSPGFYGILGDSFLRSAYVVFDLANNLTAIAQASNSTDAKPDIVTMGADETTIPGATRTGTLLVVDSAVATASYTNPADLPAQTTGAGKVKPGTPTFDLGSVTKKNYEPTSTTAGAGGGGESSAASERRVMPLWIVLAISMFAIMCIA